jgi:hypothetical protein
MAAAQHNLTRRALLGAAFALPLAPVLSEVEGRHPELVSGSSPPPIRPSSSWMLKQVQHDEKRPGTNWDRALARFQAADAALAAVAHTLDEDLYDRLGARHDAALRRLLRTPIPDSAVYPELSRRALALKLDLVLDDRAVEFIGDAAAMKSLKRDARRLAERKRDAGRLAARATG